MQIYPSIFLTRLEATNSEILAPSPEEEKEANPLSCPGDPEYHIVPSRSHKKTKVRRKTVPSLVPIYNFVSSNQQALTWRDFMSLNERAEPQIPSQLMVSLGFYYFIHTPGIRSNMAIAMFNWLVLKEKRSG